MHTFNADIIIIGAGIVGATFALDIAQKQPLLKIVIIDKILATSLSNYEFDNRIYAINPQNVEYLKKLTAWPVEKKIGTIARMEVFGDSNSNIVLDTRNSHSTFLAKVVEYNYLQMSLLKQLDIQTNITQLCADTVDVQYLEDDYIQVQTTKGYIVTKLIVAADGANSIVRKMINLPMKVIDYIQSGIIANFKTELSHNNIAYQWFKNQSVLAYLPLPDNYVSIVWSCKDAHELLKLSRDEFTQKVMHMGNNVLGNLELINTPQALPLRLNLVGKFYAKNIAFIGDAAHTIHPLAGQGVNLGLQDAYCLANILGKLSNNQIGDTINLMRYNNQRFVKVRQMQFICHGLERLFNNENFFIKKIRNLGLNIFNNLDSLKGLIINELV